MIREIEAELARLKVDHKANPKLGLRIKSDGETVRASDDYCYGIYDSARLLQVLQKTKAANFDENSKIYIWKVIQKAGHSIGG